MINWPQNRQPKKNAFVTLATDYGQMIVNRFDFNRAPDGGIYGVGHCLLETSAFDPQEINQMMQLLDLQRQIRGVGVVMLDGGANIGVHSLAAGRAMQGWGSVIAFEAQERVFYALAGNIAMNNLFNVQVKWNALAQTTSVIAIPVPDYMVPSSFGSLEMQYTDKSENIGQRIDRNHTQKVQAITIDSLDLTRLDYLKLDVEAMEEQVINGGLATIARTKPIIQVEILKSGQPLIDLIKSLGYTVYLQGADAICVANGDRLTEFIK
jgi:FkbM family methyltransferase